MPSDNPGCRRCGLYETARTVCVSGRGPAKADLLVVGQNPGYKEDRIGEPFVGDSGTLFNRMLDNLDNTISYRVTNSVRCYTPDNRKPTLEEQAACRIYIVNEIAQARPWAILVLGDSALVSLTGQGGISKKRNIPLELRADIRHNLLTSYGYTPQTLPKVLATWHPKFILRDRSHQHELEESVIAAARYVKEVRGDEFGQTVLWREWSNSYEIDQLVNDAIVVNRLDETSSIPCAVIGYDIETNALPFNHPDFKIHMLGFASSDSAYVVRREGHIKFVINYLKELQDRGLVQLVGYNSVSFDDVATGLLSRDALYLDYLIDEGISSYQGRAQKGRHKLQSSAVRHLQVPPWKDEVTWSWNEFDVFSGLWHKAALYNARDAIYTTKIYSQLHKKLSDKQHLLVEHIMQPAGRFLAKIEQRGVPISKVNLEQVRLEVEVAKEKALDTITRKAFEYDLWTFNANSPAQVAGLLFEKMGLRPINYTSSGAPSTDEETLRSLLLTCNETQTPAIKALLSYRTESKLLSTYIEKCQPEEDGRIHAGYSLTQTTTGRTTSYGWSPQRTPRDKRVRRLVAAPPGMKLVSADLSQIEMRTMAWLSQEPNMLAVYREGKYGGDLHNYIASAIARLMYGRDTYSDEERTLAKRVDFGSLYGAEWFTLQRTMLNDFGIKLSEKECKFLRDDVFFAALPGLPAYYDRVIKQAVRDGFVEGTFGLRRQLPNIHARDISLRTAAAREAINSDNQGLASYIALIGCFLVEELVPEIEQVAFIHDATIGLVRDEDTSLIAGSMKHVFENMVPEYIKSNLGVNFNVAIKLDVKISQAWGGE